MAYDADKEQIEELKSWWKDNGRVVVAGLVVGLGGVFGWQAWQQYTASRAENASRIYEEIVNWAAQGDYTRVDALSESLLGEYPKSGYAPLGALIRAHSAVAQGKLDEARGYLQWVTENGDDEYLESVANLRLARLDAETGNHEQALARLGENAPGELAALYAELRGDVLAAQDRREQAREAYDEALSTERLSPSARQRIEMKSADLGLALRQDGE